MPAKLHTFKFALAGGLITAICVFISVLAAMIWSGYASNFMSALSSIYGPLGFSVSFLGLILGTIYAFIDGFILTGIFAWIYNKLL
jgi:hypothetical protein